jgi:hypothetical protein
MLALIQVVRSAIRNFDYCSNVATDLFDKNTQIDVIKHCYFSQRHRSPNVVPFNPTSI